MNEVLQKIIEDAELKQLDNGDWTYTTPREAYELIATGVARECVSLLRSQRNLKYNDLFANMVKFHFGVNDER